MVAGLLCLHEIRVYLVWIICDKSIGGIDNTDNKPIISYSHTANVEDCSLVAFDTPAATKHLTFLQQWRQIVTASPITDNWITYS